MQQENNIYRGDAPGTTWTKIGEFTGSYQNAYSGLGPAISYDGNRITYTEKDFNTDADGNTASNIGRVRIYDYSGTGTSWDQVGNPLWRSC